MIGRRVLRWLRRACIAVLAAVAIASVMASTEAGTRWLLGAVDALAGPRLAIGGVEGEALGRLALRAFEVRHEGVTVRIDRLALDWSPGGLIDAHLFLRSLEAEGVRVTLPETPAERKEAPLPALRLPLAITIAHAALRDGLIERAEGETRLRSIVLNATADVREIDLGALHVTGEDWEARLAGRVEPVPPYPHSARLDWNAAIEGEPVRGRLRSEGDADRLEVQGRVVGSFEIETAGALVREADGWRVELGGAWQALRWPLRGEPTVSSRRGRYAVSGTLEAFTLRLEGDVVHAELPIEHALVEGTGRVEPAGALPFELAARYRLGTTLEAALEGEVSAEGDRSRVELDHRLSAPFTARTQGRVRLADGGPRVALSTQWTGARWPLHGPAAVVSPAGNLDVEGPLSALAVRALAKLELPGAPVEDLSISADLEAGARAPYPLAGELAWQARLGHAPLAGSARIAGDLQSPLSIVHRLSSPFAMQTEATLRLDGAPPRLTAAGSWEGLRWPLEGEARLASARGRYQTSGWIDDLALDIEADLEARDLPPDLAIETVTLSARGGLTGEPRAAHRATLRWAAALGDGSRLEGAGTIAGDTSKLALDHRLEVPFELTTTGSVASSGPELILDLAGEWRDAEWPLGEAARYRSPLGRYSARGPLGALALHLEGETLADGYPSLDVSLDGIGDPAGLAVQRLTVAALDGTLAAGGRLDWTPAPAWRLRAEIRGADPGRHWPEWPGRVNAVIESAGRLEAKALHASALIETLSGELRGYPVAGSGRLRLEGGTLEAKGLALSSGANRLHLDATYAEALDLRFEVDAPDLSQLWPGLAGRLAAQGSARGDPALPDLDLSLDAAQLRYHGQSIRALSAEASIKPHESAQSSVRATLEGWRAAGRDIEALIVRGAGTPSEHAVTLELRSALGRLDAQLRGALAAKRWAGEIESLEVRTPEAGRWQLERRVPLAGGSGSAQLGPACLAGEGERRLCLEGSWERASGDLALEARLAALPLSIALPWLPAQASLTGHLDGEASLSRKRGRLAGDISASVSPGRFDLPQADARALSVTHRDTSAEVRIAGSDLSARLSSTIADDGHLRAELAVRGWDGRGALQGRVEGELPDLDLLAPFVPRLAEAQGRAGLALEVGGTLEAPRLEGGLRVAVDRALVPELGLELADGELRMRSAGTERMALSGAIRSGEGRLDLDGALRAAPGEGWPVVLSLAGTDLEVMRLPAAHVLASPDLRLSTSAAGIEVEGRVLIPRARITPKEVAKGAVKVSGDEVLVNRPVAPEASVESPGDGVAALDVVVTLGEEVIFDGFGLSTRLEGEIALEQDAEHTLTARGELRLREGRYKAYGQQLEIDHGRLIFAGPVDNPGLDLRAVRKSGNVTAGIVVGGTAKSIRSRVFSEPAMSQAEALSYLLTGRPLSGSSQGDAALLSQAALALGLEGAELLTEQLRSALGLDELGVGSAGSDDQSALIVGKRLSPDLTIRYALGLFDRVGSVLLNYRLTDHLSVEAESGARQSMDLLFSIERDKLLP